MKNNSLFSTLQRVGRAFMLPVALLPAAGLLLGIGGAFTNDTMISAYSLQAILGQGTILRAILTIMRDAGEIVFVNLPLLFAIGIAVGMADNDKGTAALAAAIGFFIMHKVISSTLMLQGVNPSTVTPNAIMQSQGVSYEVAVALSQKYGRELGIFTLNLSVLGGIMVGLMAAALHNRFYQIQLPMGLEFFGGNRFVPIITAVCMIPVGIAMTFIWPHIQNVIATIGLFVQKSGYIGTLVYGFSGRMLNVFGLHHLLYLPLWQTAMGGTMMVDGNLVAGGQNIFFAQLASPNTTRFSAEATRFMTGGFPVMMFGLPAAAFAMYQMAKDNKRKIVASILLSAALTSFLTGITEPIEFLFLFCAPVLYVIHAVLEGISYMLMHMLNVAVGITFSRGIIDLTLFGVLQGQAKTNWLTILPIGAIYAVIYYFLFRWAIKTFDLKTPGREDEDSAVYSEEHGDKELIISLFEAFGGHDNITVLDNCITRLRIQVVDPAKVASDARWTELGAKGVFRSGQGIQVIYGTRANILKNRMEKMWKK